MKLRKNSGKILWGLFFILAAVYVVVSKLWIMPEISVFSVLLTVFFIWLFLNGIRNVNFWEILFSIAFICIIYDDWLGITALTQWNEDGKYIGENIKIDNNFGTAIKYVNSDNFCMADVDNSFGSLTVYFDNAIIQSGSAKIKVDNSFGETNLYIPKEWKTENNLGQAFGSVKIHGVCEGSSNNTLKLKGETSFGEINIYYI